MGTKVGKYKFGVRAGKYKLGAQAGKSQLRARAGGRSQEPGARARPRGQAKGRQSGNKNNPEKRTYAWFGGKELTGKSIFNKEP